MTSPPTSSGWQVDSPSCSAADLAGDDLVAARALVDRAAEAHREAAARLGVLQRLGERGVLGQRHGGLEAVAAVVADEHGDRRVGRAGLEVADEQLVALGLVLGDLHRLAEARLAVGVAALDVVVLGLDGADGGDGAAAAEDERQRDRAEHDAEHEDQLHRARARRPRAPRPGARRGTRW